MSSAENFWEQIRMFCPACGLRLSVRRKSARVFLAECCKCHIVLVKKLLGRRHDRLDIYPRLSKD